MKLISNVIYDEDTGERDINNIGIVVENDYNDILYHNNHFIIDLDISGKEKRYAIECKLEEILEGKPFRIEWVSKQIPKLKLSNEHDKRDNMTMYLVRVYMYSDDSNFEKKEKVLDRINNPFYNDYFLKYLIRYNKYKELIYSVTSGIFPILYVITALNDEFRLPSLFDNFWFAMIVYIVIPLAILHMIIIPWIVNYLLRYDISEKVFKLKGLVVLVSWSIYAVALFYVI